MIGEETAVIALAKLGTAIAGTDAAFVMTAGGPYLLVAVTAQ